MSVKELLDLDTLDRSLLHIFVAGPGKGEGIAVALPEAGWLLVDSCKILGGDAGDDLPLKAVLAKWRRPIGDPDAVEWMVLTHPHSDHCDGFAELVDQFEPERIGLSGPPPPGQTALNVLQTWLHGTTAENLSKKQVESALLAIAAWQDKYARALTHLNQGTRVWPPEDAGDGYAGPIIDVLAPDGDLLAPAGQLTWPNYRSGANGMSTVLRLRWGALDVWLTGDLPRYHTSGRQLTPAPMGWDHVFAQHPELREVSAHLKVPHHGSRPALHPDLLTWDRNDQPETWVTPYSNSKLPKAGAGEGMDMLLGARAQVRVTALPISRHKQPPRPVAAQMTHAEYGQAIHHPDTPAHAVEVTPPHITDPEAPIWAAAFDASGACVDRWRGSVAFTVAEHVNDLETRFLAI